MDSSTEKPLCGAGIYRKRKKSARARGAPGVIKSG
jgi:hypothetical protein